MNIISCTFKTTATTYLIFCIANGCKWFDTFCSCSKALDFENYKTWQILDQLLMSLSLSSSDRAWTVITLGPPTCILQLLYVCTVVCLLWWTFEYTTDFLGVLWRMYHTAPIETVIITPKSKTTIQRVEDELESFFDVSSSSSRGFTVTSLFSYKKKKIHVYIKFKAPPFFHRRSLWHWYENFYSFNHRPMKYTVYKETFASVLFLLPSTTSSMDEWKSCHFSLFIMTLRI